MSRPEALLEVEPVVLIVDDHRENLVAFEAALAPLAASDDVRIVLADSAEEALRHALAMGDRLAVVLLDVMMPGTDGPETARLIRARRQTAHVPVIFVTALDADRRRLTDAYASGAVDYLTKPVDPDLLRAKVGAFVGLHRRQAEGRARERRRSADRARARLGAVLDALPDAVITVDAEWRVVYVNPEAARRLHASARDSEAAIGRLLWDVAPELLGTRGEAELRRAARQRRTVAFEACVAETGLWLDHRVVPGPDGTLTLFSRDITPRVAAEAALRESEARLAGIIGSAMDAIISADEARRIVLFNTAAERMFGVVAAEALGAPLDRFIPSRFREAHAAHMRQIGAAGVSMRAMQRSRHRAEPLAALRADGTEFPVEATISQVVIGGRRLFTVLLRDVTERVAAEAEREHLLAAEHAARERAERLQALTTALVRARTLDDVATVVIAEMVADLGARTGALAVRAPEGDDLVLVRHVGFSPAAVTQIQRQPIDGRGPVPECFRSAAPVWIESRGGDEGFDVRYPALVGVWDALGVAAGLCVPLVAAGETVGVISFGFAAPHTFSPEEREFLLVLGRQAALAVERARLFEAERAARREAEAANRAKGEFLAVMSHELRTPLNAIGGYAELMELGLRGPVSEQQRTDLGRIQQSQRHLLGLINQVLNFTSVGAGAVRYDVADVRVDEALAAAEGLVLPQLRAKGLAYGSEEAPPELAVRADREKLQQILLNLLSNAIKFTEPGGKVHVSCVAHADVVSLTVRDTGIGIAPEKLASIFEPFVQVDQRLARAHDGVGLGLAISRDLARGMGGDLSAASTPGQGSAFTLTLPRARVA